MWHTFLVFFLSLSLHDKIMHFERQILFNEKNYGNSEALYKVKDLENGG